MQYNINKLKLEPNGGKYWTLAEDFYLDSEYGTALKIPKGFKTDLASIPSIFWTIMPPFGDYTKSAVVHDYLYSKNNTMLTRAESDRIFLELMKEAGVGLVKRRTMYRAVRMFGRSSFKGSNKN